MKDKEYPARKTVDQEASSFHSVFCIHCGAKAAAGQRFCANCGQPLQAQQPACQPAVTYQPIYVHVQQPEPKKAKVPCLLFAILGLVFCWAPIVGLLFSGLGLLLSIVAAVKGRGGKAVVGIVFSGIGLLVGYAVNIYLYTDVYAGLF